MAQSIMLETDLAWVAGFFDGEGSLNLSLRQHRGGRQGKYWVVRARVANTHGLSIKHLQEIFGFGRIRTMPGQSIRHRPVYEWAVEAKSAEIFLKAIVPYSVTKKEQIQLAIFGADLRRNSPRLARGRGYGRGAPSITVETHSRLLEISNHIKLHNGHKPLLKAI